MADWEPAEGRIRPIIRSKPGRRARARSSKPITTWTRSGSAKVYRAQLEAKLAELADRQLVEAWLLVCPFAVPRACDMPDRLGMIQDLADIAEALQPSLQEATADQLCWLVKQYGDGGGVRNRRRVGFLVPRHRIADT
jgi:hypothetical protein